MIRKWCQETPSSRVSKEIVCNIHDRGRQDCSPGFVQFYNVDTSQSLEKYFLDYNSQYPINSSIPAGWWILEVAVQYNEMCTLKSADR